MTLFACGRLTLGVLAFMIVPMLEGSSQRRPWAVRSRQDDLLKKKDFIYASIRELDIDFNMGKLAAEDHKLLQQEYINEASEVLDELDQFVEIDMPIEEKIEKEVLDLRNRNTKSPIKSDNKEPTLDHIDGLDETETSSTGKVVLSEGQLLCRHCGKHNEEYSNFCVECGTSLETYTCGGCGKENQPSANFCSECGEKLG